MGRSCTKLATRTCTADGMRSANRGINLDKADKWAHAKPTTRAPEKENGLDKVSKRAGAKLTAGSRLVRA